jgi:hypothetical protein
VWPAAAGYTVTIGSIGGYRYPDDTPAAPFIDQDGTFHFQESHSLYGATDGRTWSFYTGTDFATARPDQQLDTAVNPANPQDSNADTTWRCDTSPTGLSATSAPAGSGYAQPNYCDLVGVWVDPDTGDWYGLVHNEFTPEPFGDGLHYDSIDYAVSHDQGHTWTIEGHAITSPYSTTRGDTAAFPNQTYDYGDGDPRLFVDYASGYFYVYYGSRIVPKGGVGGSTDGLAHVARAPISGKMAAGTWQKWYDGSWSQPGVGGKESNMVPATTADPKGYTPVAKDYNPADTGNVDQQIAAGVLPSKSPLFIMNIAYDAYLGLYIGEPENATDAPAAQQYYVTDNLATQKWYLAGTSGSYTDQSWYRWFLDSANLTSSTVIGKSFRAYCAIACHSSDGEYADVTVDSTAPATAPFSPDRTYRIADGDGRVLAQAATGSGTVSRANAGSPATADWAFVANGDGSYQIVNSGTGKLLGVDSATTSSRAWGTAPTVTAPGAHGPTVGQQWFAIRDTSPANGAATSGYRLVNRYSGLVLGLTPGHGGTAAETTPARYWTDTTGSSVGGGRTAAEQTLTMTAVGRVSGAVTVTPVATQTWTQGTPARLQITASSSTGAKPSFEAIGLPAGLSIDAATGVVSGTADLLADGTATVTVRSGTASAHVSFSWAVAPGPDLSGTHTLVTGGEALDDPAHSTTPGTQLDTWTANGGANQSWQFTRQPDGTYQIANTESGLCMDDDGAATTAGTPAIQWTCTGATNQHWLVARQPDGSYTVTDMTSGLLLTTASTADGSLVAQQPDTGSPLQQWTIQ